MFALFESAFVFHVGSTFRLFFYRERFWTLQRAALYPLRVNFVPPEAVILSWRAPHSIHADGVQMIANVRGRQRAIFSLYPLDALFPYTR